MQLSEKLDLKLGDYGEYFELRLKKDNGGIHATVVGRNTSSADGEYKYELVRHREAKDRTDFNTVASCGVLEGHDCSPEYTYVDVDSPIWALDSAIRYLEQQYPSFFRNID